jgi:hypothetical protein
MPIKPELRKFYGREWRTVTRPRILERAGDKCENCKVPNHAIVWRMAHGLWRHMSVYGEPAMSRPGNSHEVKIVLTIAHLNHMAGDDRPENLKALCQWCHLDYDKHHHHITRAVRKDAARPILAAVLRP